MKNKQEQNQDYRDKVLQMYFVAAPKVLPEPSEFLYQSRGITLEFLDYYCEDTRRSDPSTFIDTMEHFFFNYFGISMTYDRNILMKELRSAPSLSGSALLWDYSFKAARMRKESTMWILSAFNFNPLLKGHLFDIIRESLYTYIRDEMDKVENLEAFDMYPTVHRWVQSYISKNREECQKLLDGKVQCL